MLAMRSHSTPPRLEFRYHGATAMREKARMHASTKERPGRLERTSPSSKRESLGTLALLFAAAVVCLAVIDESAGLPFGMPRSWYISRPLWYLAAFAVFLAGCAVLRTPRRHSSGAWKPDRPGRRFERMILYTRSGCHLCDQAKDTLLSYARWLPPLEEVDIETDPVLLERFDTCIPVVEIDGRVRFRGIVNEVLLRRQIEGTPPRDVVQITQTGNEPRLH